MELHNGRFEKSKKTWGFLKVVLKGLDGVIYDAGKELETPRYKVSLEESGKISTCDGSLILLKIYISI